MKSTSVLVVGDLHLSDKFQGQHKDYYANCVEVMDAIELKVQALKAEHGSVSLLLLGDLFGVSEKRFTTRVFFLRVVEWFMRLNQVCDEVATVRGNHDISHTDLPDFDVLKELGCFSNPRKLDWELSGDEGIRFHFVNYGHELDPLELKKDWGNIVLAHNDFGSTVGYSGDNQITNMPWEGVDLVISGHIHTPSIDDVYIQMGTGDIPLVYLGCPTRVAERVPDVFVMEFVASQNEVSYSKKLFGLKPVDEEFHPRVEKPSSVDKEVEKQRLESLKSIVGSLNTKRLVGVNLLELIEQRSDISPSVKKLCIKLLKDELE